MQLNLIRVATGALVIGSALALTACIPPAPEPTPAPSPAPAPTQAAEPSQAPPQVITPTYDNWMDAPQTPGDWRYAAQTGAPAATFGPTGTGSLFALHCDRANRSVALQRQSSVQAARTMRIRTETLDRELRAEPGAGGLIASVPATDSFLDAMAFSKGRFAVEIAGEPTLYVPAWPEVTRVIEECRR
ncbi:MAG: hypothetical protein JY451_10650 [Erythrobacter sp.]|nr:MAG: hypothetical protein JY451_10650 [Erythrobacter sp.]